MYFTENELQGFSKPLSASETERCKHAISMIRDALKKQGFTSGEIQRIANQDAAFIVHLKKGSLESITVFVQGSFANNTNVKAHSDVDIAVINEAVFRTKHRFGVTDTDYGFAPSSTTAKQFKNEVQNALEAKFGNDVTRGNKSIKVCGNGYRVDADVVPALRYRDYSDDWNNDKSNYIGGIVIVPDKGGSIVNYPEQHIELGRQKNNKTNHYYKKMVRIAKKIKLLMEDEGYSSAKTTSSFFIESLIWNIPNSYFTKYSSLKFIFEDIIEYLVSNKIQLSQFREANGIKALCPDQTTLDRAGSFIDDLSSFYNYI